MKRAPRKRNEYPKKRKGGGTVDAAEEKPRHAKAKVSFPRAPDWLPAEAKRQFRALSKDLTVAGTLRMSDAPALAAYCKACYDAEQAEQKITDSGGEVITGPNGGLVWNIWVTVRNDARSAVLKFGEQFGLTPKSRLKVKAPPRDPGVKDDKDPDQMDFGNLIDGGREFIRNQPWRKTDDDEGKAG